MLKIKDGVNLEILKNYGFKKEPEKSYFLKEVYDGAYIEIQIYKNDVLFKPRYININTDKAVLFYDLDVLYDLIKDDLIVKESINEYYR